MKIFNSKWELITEYDLSKGQLVDTEIVKEDAIPIDNINKFAWDDSDYEPVKMYIEDLPEDNEESKIDALEKKVQELESIIQNLSIQEEHK